MPPTVILIRHAQALHNYSIPDPPLSSPLGLEKQCTELQEALKTDPIAQKAELIVISPMRRTLQTAQQGLGFLIDRGVPVILRAEWQENSDKPCDTGSPIPIISREFPNFDWSAVDPVWPSKTGLYRFSREGLMERGTMAKEWLRSRPEKVIVVVSHSGFLRVGVSHKGYYNADYRIFEFGEGEKEGDLVELDVTEKNGGGLGKSNYGTYYLGPGMQTFNFFLVDSCYKVVHGVEALWQSRKRKKDADGALVGDYPSDADTATPVEEAAAEENGGK